MKRRSFTTSMAAELFDWNDPWSEGLWITTDSLTLVTSFCLWLPLDAGYLETAISRYASDPRPPLVLLARWCISNRRGDKFPDAYYLLNLHCDADALACSQNSAKRTICFLHEIKSQSFLHNNATICRWFDKCWLEVSCHFVRNVSACFPGFFLICRYM